MAEFKGEEDFTNRIEIVVYSKARRDLKHDPQIDIHLFLWFWRTGWLGHFLYQPSDLPSIGALAIHNVHKGIESSSCITQKIVYCSVCSFMRWPGIFFFRYHVELILFVPVGAGFLTYYLKVGLLEDSLAQNPEKLFRERGFVLYAGLSVLLFLLLMFIEIPFLYEVFNIKPSVVSPLWIIDGK